MDIRELDRRAMDVTARLVPLVTTEHWHRPTPCEGWQVHDLLAHILGQYHGFALAASGYPTSLKDFRPRPVRVENLVADYTAAADRVNTAFTEPGVLERQFHLPEIRDGGSFPATAAIGFHLVDEVVHAWDLAKSIGTTVDFDAEVEKVALAVAVRVPDDPASRGPGSAFAPGYRPDPELPVLDRIVALLGRRPDWSPAG
ncbi:TIGR03086 family metal-binding protein [Jatrophihabitans sp.]|uniref:TIGR03086 family metal-binding protein n=1 Tax=Jatrophihabitans sp. TaxID=1932789 RepID=UPI002BC88D85|nr:TIGR03086 family metal-binding protein [Jatrophihabitans sp.]